MAEKPSIPKGTRDFTPEVMIKRNYIFDTIRKVFEQYGFLPVETPAMENLSTLLGKYGEEGDKLLFRVLNSGNFLQGVAADELQESNLVRLSARICEKGLRYDLTVPFARFVVQHQHELTFPFRRYQIQPVWRADRPQKGRYREFYQCDADIVGSDSLLNEADLLSMVDEVFARLSIRVVIKLNNRKILAGIAEIIGCSEQITDITVAIDKLEKIGKDAVFEELRQKGVSEVALEALEPILALAGSNRAKCEQLTKILAESEVGLKGVAELIEVFDYLDDSPLRATVELDLALARGLNYYTGAIIEVKSADVVIGSISGGGRYDNLTGIFGLEGISGVGVSFGADRIYDVLEQLGGFPESQTRSAQVLFLNFGKSEMKYCLPVVRRLQAGGVRACFYPDAVKLKKQMAFADKLSIRYVVMAGEEEMREQIFMLKDMADGQQRPMSSGELMTFFGLLA